MGGGGGGRFGANKAVCSCNNTPMPNLSWYNVSNSLPVVGVKFGVGKAFWPREYSLSGVQAPAYHSSCDWSVAMEILRRTLNGRWP